MRTGRAQIFSVWVGELLLVCACVTAGSRRQERTSSSASGGMMSAQRNSEEMELSELSTARFPSQGRKG